MQCWHVLDAAALARSLGGACGRRLHQGAEAVGGGGSVENRRRAAARAESAKRISDRRRAVQAAAVDDRRAALDSHISAAAQAAGDAIDRLAELAPETIARGRAAVGRASIREYGSGRRPRFDRAARLDRYIKRESLRRDRAEREAREALRDGIASIRAAEVAARRALAKLGIAI